MLTEFETKAGIRLWVDVGTTGGDGGRHALEMKRRLAWKAKYCVVVASGGVCRIKAVVVVAKAGRCYAWK